jgi:hypothetical protein
MSSTIYNTTTGAILTCIGLDDVPATDSTDSISGQYPGNVYYIDVATRLPVEIPPRPADGNYLWNPISKTWDIVS